MEEGGHYYTVYTTSLAVGFKEPLAFQHAVLAQMPDEVGWLDAANLHMKQIFSGSDVNTAGQNSRIPNDWRYQVEYGLHSLPGSHLSQNTQTSAYQRSFTTQQLLREDAASLRFGLLLHRIGDAYAHSRMNGGESMMYTVTPGDTRKGWNIIDHHGHGHRLHDPDYPFLRPELFVSYLQNLYDILHKKAAAPENKTHLRNSGVVSFATLKAAFMQAFAAVKQRGDNNYMKHLEMASRVPTFGHPVVILKSSVVSKEMEAQWLIQEIRAAARRVTGTELRNYSPEKEGARPLAQFLKEHPELNHLNINNEAVVNAVRDMIPPPGQPDPPGYFESMSNDFKWHLNNFSNRPWQYFPGGSGRY
jgi:hypothetical protein